MGRTTSAPISALSFIVDKDQGLRSGILSYNVNPVKWGSEIWTSLDFKWSKRGWVQMVWISNGILNPEAQPFEISTNGHLLSDTI